MDTRKGNAEALIAQPTFTVKKTDLVCLFFSEKIDVKRLSRSSKTSWKTVVEDFVSGILKDQLSQSMLHNHKSHAHNISANHTLFKCSFGFCCSRLSPDS